MVDYQSPSPHPPRGGLSLAPPRVPRRSLFRESVDHPTQRVRVDIPDERRGTARLRGVFGAPGSDGEMMTLWQG